MLNGFVGNSSKKFLYFLNVTSTHLLKYNQSCIHKFKIIPEVDWSMVPEQWPDRKHSQDNLHRS